MKEKVIVKKVADIFHDLRDAIQSIDSWNVTDNDYIVIKPNLCDFRPAYEGGTTDPRIIEALVKIIREKANPRLAIVESNHAVGNADDEFERLGYAALASDLNIELINLSNDKRYTVALDGYFFKNLEVPESLLKATKIISVAKLKTHAQQKITCNMKNLFGLIPRKAKAKYHPFMNEVLADLNGFYKPALCIIDGLVCMEGFGPSDGDKKEVGIIICGTNPVATDSVAASIMGFNPSSVPCLKYAEKKGLGSTKDIDVVGDITTIGKFNFIPIYSYLAYRFSFLLSRSTNKASNFVDNFAKFISQAGVGFLVLRRGSFFIPDFGEVTRRSAFSYAKGLILRPIIVLMLKIRRI